MRLSLKESLILKNSFHIPPFFYYFLIFITMRKRHWKNRKNRKCPTCTRILTYSRKDSFDRAVGNNSVCKSCAQTDRKVTMETLEKMKQPKTVEHRKKISRSMKTRWEKLREKEYGFTRQ
jgi:hypothetical protein